MPVYAPKDLTSAPLDDICREKHGGNTYSELANIQAHEGKQRRREAVLDFIRSQGTYGATVDEYSAFTGLAPNVVSGRFTELKKTGHIEPAGHERRTRLGSLAAAWRIPLEKGQLSLL